MKQPAEFEILDYRKENATDLGNGLWLIDNVACPDRMARDLAELAMLTGQRLTRYPSLGGTLAVARRVAVLEQQVAALMEKVRL